MGLPEEHDEALRIAMERMNQCAKQAQFPGAVRGILWAVVLMALAIVVTGWALRMLLGGG